VVSTKAKIFIIETFINFNMPAYGARPIKVYIKSRAINIHDSL